MSIKIIEEPTIHLTRSECDRLLQEYRQAFLFYSGVPPSFEEWVRGRKESAAERKP